MTRFQAVLFAATATALAVTAGPATAQQEVKITYLSGFPPPTTFVGAFTNDYVKAVDAALAKTGKYKISWILAHSGQVAKPRGEIEAMQSGLGDISTVPASLSADKIPLYNVVYATPFTSDDPGYLSATIQKVSASLPAFDKMWGGHNQQALGVTANVDNYVIISSQPLNKLSDLKGIKVGAAGPNLPWVVPTGAAGVTTNLADAYNSLSTGIYAAMIAWPQAMGSFKLCEPAPHMLDAGLGASSIIIMTVNRDAFKSWPAEVQQAMTGNANVWHKAQIAAVVDGAKAGIEKCRAEYKLKEAKMSPADIKAWAMSLPPLGLQWAASMDEKGQPGKAILSQFMDEMRAGKQRVTRQWDKE